MEFIFIVILIKKIFVILISKESLWYSLYRVLEFIHELNTIFFCLRNYRNINCSNLQIVFHDDVFIGYCAYYNTNNKEIMENYDQGFECLKFPTGERCPARYPSSEAYKCKFS